MNYYFDMSGDIKEEEVYKLWSTIGVISRKKLTNSRLFSSSAIGQFYKTYYIYCGPRLMHNR